MQVLLINPPEQQTLPTNLPGAVEKLRGIMPPLSLMCVAAAVRSSGRHAVSLLDASALNLTGGALEAAVRKISPDVVGFSVTTFTLLDAVEAARSVRKAAPGTTIVAGGLQPSLYPEQTAQLGVFDYCFSGEGEMTLPGFLDALEKGRPLRDIPGIIYYAEGAFICNPPPAPVEELDNFPFPAHDLLARGLYTSLVTGLHPVSITITSRGCPYRCAYCSRSVTGKTYRSRSPENIAEEMAWCETLGIRYLLIYDEVMTISEKRVLQLCELLLQQGTKMKWMARARAETLTSNMLSAMKKAGCDLVTVGIESGSPEVLRRLNRPTDIAALIEAFQMIHRAGLRSIAYFMVGCPGEKNTDLRASLQVARRAAPDMIHASVFVPYPATALYREGLATGRFENDYWKAFSRNPFPEFRPRLWSEPGTEKKIQGRLIWFYRRYYLRPGYILRQLWRIRRKEDIMRNLRGLLVLLASRSWFSSKTPTTAKTDRAKSA